MNKPIIEVITGCMFAGKTRALIERIRTFEKEGTSVVVVKPDIDTRYSASYIVSHDGFRHNNVYSIPQHDIEHIAKKGSVIAVDEAQFLDAPLVDRILSIASVAVFAGLDLDWRGEHFGQMGRLTQVADKITQLRAVCARCGAPATRSFLMARSDGVQRILVGGAERYEPRCRTCFEDGMVASTQSVGPWCPSAPPPPVA